MRSIFRIVAIFVSLVFAMGCKASTSSSSGPMSPTLLPAPESLPDFSPPPVVVVPSEAGVVSTRDGVPVEVTFSIKSWPYGTRFITFECWSASPDVPSVDCPWVGGGSIGPGSYVSGSDRANSPPGEYWYYLVIVQKWTIAGWPPMPVPYPDPIRPGTLPDGALHFSAPSHVIFR